MDFTKTATKIDKFGVEQLVVEDIPFKKPAVTTVPLYIPKGIEVDVLRLDTVHPVISGNKWYKLRYYLKEAVEQGKKYIITFGGPYSNHIMASAAAARQAGLFSVGIIRGEGFQKLSNTLKDAAECGMELVFSSYEDYRNKKIPAGVLNTVGGPDAYMINEGGYGIPGRQGAATILEEIPIAGYTHILAATGTGTMLAGLITAAQCSQTVTGISVLKNNFSVEPAIAALLPKERQTDFTILYDYHFGGYAKKDEVLIRFMNTWFRQTGIPSDFVYTGKLFFALDNLIQKQYFPQGSKVLVIHSGGLQGNRSLPKGTLIF